VAAPQGRGLERRHRETLAVDGDGNSTSYGYDELGDRVTAATYARGSGTPLTTASYAFDGAGREVLAIDGDHNTTSYTYDAEGDTLTESVTAANGQLVAQTSYGYDGDGRVIKQVDGDGNSTTYGYDASGRLITVTDPAGGATQYTYDAAGRMATLRDARNIVFLRNDYYTSGVDAGRVWKQTRADTTTFQFAYTSDAQSRITQTDVTDPRGVVERITFNAAGYTLSETQVASSSGNYLASRVEGAHDRAAALARGAPFCYRLASTAGNDRRSFGVSDAEGAPRRSAVFRPDDRVEPVRAPPEHYDHRHRLCRALPHVARHCAREVEAPGQSSRGRTLDSTSCRSCRNNYS